MDERSCNFRKDVTKVVFYTRNLQQISKLTTKPSHSNIHNNTSTIHMKPHKRLLCFSMCDDFVVNYIHTQSAPAFFSIGTRDLSRWRLITSLVPPTSFPPMNTAGTTGLHPSLARACSISLPRGISSSWWIAGFTPKSESKAFTRWHMQQELLLKITTGLSDTILVTLSISLMTQALRICVLIRVQIDGDQGFAGWMRSNASPCNVFIGKC